MLFFCSAFFKPWHIKIVFCLNTILLPSLRDKLPFYKPLPTTMNHQQCRQGTPTEVVVLVLCLSIKVMCICLWSMCVRWCAFLMFAPFLTARCQYFYCQVPISNSAMRGDCKWNLRRRNRSIWGWERNENGVIFALTQSGFLYFISMGARNVKYIQYQSILIPIKCHIQPKTFQVIDKVF